MLKSGLMLKLVALLYLTIVQDAKKTTKFYTFIIMSRTDSVFC